MVRKNLSLIEEEKKYLNFISLVLSVFYDIIINTIQINQKNENDNIKKNILSRSFQKCKIIFKFLKELECNDKTIEVLNNYIYFSDNIKHFDLELNKYILLVKYFFRKSLKQNKNLNKSRLLSENNELFLNLYSELKYVNWIFGL